MKYCNDFAALLDLYADGELSAEEMIRVQEHLDSCPGCRAYVDAVFAMRAAFPDAEDTAVPAGFADAVMDAVRRAPRQRKRKTPWVKVLTPLAACCAIVILLQSGNMLRGTKSDSAFFAAKEAAPAESAAFDMMADSAMVKTESFTTTGSVTEDSAIESPKSSAREPEEGAFTYPVEPGASEPAEPNYATVLYLPSECLELLADMTPLTESDSDVRYELDAAAAEALQTQLNTREITYAVGCAADPTTDMILVVVEK